MKSENQKLKAIEVYIRKNHKKMLEIFKSYSTEQQIEAKKVFAYMQEAYSLDGCNILLFNENYFRNEENSVHMESLIQSYYQATQNTSKFYLYRVKFTFQELGQLIQHWIKNQPGLDIQYGPDNTDNNGLNLEQLSNSQDLMKSTGNRKQNFQSSQLQNQQSLMVEDDHNRQQQREDNQFIIPKKKLPNLIQQYEKQLKAKQQLFQNGSLTPTSKKKIDGQLRQLKIKLKIMKNSIEEKQLKQQSPISSTKSKSKKAVGKINYKAIFEYYAKQVQYIGVHNTFGRIQHESKYINYQKLVHFLRQFQILPKKSKQKQLHSAYVRSCTNTRDLDFDGFMKILDVLPQLLFSKGDKEQKKNQFLVMINQKSISKGKLLHYPFHSPEKEDFRINQDQLKYSFKLKPQQGRFSDQVTDKLQQLKKEKLQIKQQSNRKRQMRQRRKLKKLQSIDPFHPSIINNPLLLAQEKLPKEKIASLDNMQNYRDKNFDLGSFLGIKNSKQDIMNEIGSSIVMDSKKRAQKIQKQEGQRLKMLMDGIIDRSESKLQKMKTRQRSSQK